MGFPCGSASKESTCNVGDLGSIPGLERSPGEGKGYPLQYSGLKNSMDCIGHGVTKSQTQLSDFHFRTASESQKLSWIQVNIFGENSNYRDIILCLLKHLIICRGDILVTFEFLISHKLFF